MYGVDYIEEQIGEAETRLALIKNCCAQVMTAAYTGKSADEVVALLNRLTDGLFVSAKAFDEAVLFIRESVTDGTPEGVKDALDDLFHADECQFKDEIALWTSRNSHEALRERATL